MRNSTLFICLVIVGQGLFGQQIQKNTGNISFQKCTSFGISKPLKELAELYPANPNVKSVEKEIQNKRFAHEKLNSNALPIGEDPIAQKNNGVKSMGAPMVNWQGQSGSGYPPDPSGAAGPNHYVQAVNTTYRAYDKTGTPLMNELNLSSLWAGSSDAGDPIVMYDKFADRWFISQFQMNNSILIAISTTPDPTGTFYTYTFLPSSTDFPDYPKFSIWSDGYYMTSNYTTQRVVVFERVKMIAGNSGAGMIVNTLPASPSSNGFYCPLPADADGQLPPYGTPCYMFSFEDDGWGAPATKDQIRIFKMTTNWTTPTNTTLVLDTVLPTQPFDAVFTTSWDDISQKGVTDKLDALAGIFYYRAQYSIWPSHNTVTLCNAVKISTATGQAGIRWYELRQNNTTKFWSIYQQGTYAPDAENRWAGSIAMDINGNIAMAYAVSGANTYPSIHYTGRTPGDTLGQMTFAEQIAVVGTSAQTGINRFGDYSQTSLDPDGITFWHTNEYQSNGNQTRIFSFQLSKAIGIQDNKNDVKFITYQSGNTLFVKASGLPSNENMLTDLFDISGKQISSKFIAPISNSFEANIDVTGLAKGVYLIRVGNNIFQRVIKMMIY